MSPGKHDLLDGEEAEDFGSLKVNKEYAARFKHNKEREDLHRLQEKQKRGLLPADDGSESSEEEEDEGAIKPETEVKILDVIKRIRAKDPSIYDPSSNFFKGDNEDGSEEEGSSEEEEEEESAARKTRRSKPMLLKDVIAKQAIEDAENGGPGDSDEDGDAEPKGPTYVEEQASLKRAFLDAAGESDGGDDAEDADSVGGGLKVRSRGPKAEDEPADAKVKDMLGAVFGEKEAEMNDGDRFLRNFILNKGWVEEGDDDELVGLDGGVEVSDEEEQLDAQDNFEQRHNFRFEEEGGAKIATHSREVEGSIRKKDDRRKRQREARAARKAAEKEEAADDLKRLKNIKKKELNTKIKKMQALAGKGASREERLLMELMEKDFDPEEYDKQMALAFGDEYYQQGSGAGAEMEENVLDPAAQKELAEMGYADEDADGEGLAALRERLGFGAGVADWEVAEEGGEGAEDGADAEASAESKAEVMKALEEYYKLDYEQDIGGLKCRFNYKDVDAEDFGMEAEEVLGMPDKALNELVGLRVLAPYREDAWRLKKLRYKVQSALGPKRKKDQERIEKRAGQKQEKKHRKAMERKSQKQAKANAATEGTEVGAEEDAGQKKASKGKKAKAKGTKVAAEAAIGDKDDSAAETSEDKKQVDRFSRLSSYAVPKLAKPASAGGGDKSKQGGAQKKRKAESKPPEPNSEYAGLTKAQKKNKKRAEMRAAKRAKVDAA